MLMTFGVGNRMGWSTDGNGATTTALGLGFTWWNW